MTRAYYNEKDRFAAQWLRMLITCGLIAEGDVDDRSIEDVTPSDIAGYTQCHFFAGIGGWSYALRLAGWPDSRPVWTLSCPCQPFSAAGTGGGITDERHLWPAAHWLIAQRRPITIFGEQVASKDGLSWLDIVFADLERTAYSAGASDICAASIGAPHIRQRLYFRANSLFSRPDSANSDGRGGKCGTKEGIGETGERRRGSSGDSSISERGNSIPTGLQGYIGNVSNRGKPGWLGEIETRSVAETGATRGFWRNCDWWAGRDEKYRPIEPGLLPLAHGVSGRVGKLRGYGNAIVPELAAEFIKASEEI